MLKLIIFDFDGVIADTEALHLRAFQKILAEEGETLSEEEYYEIYLAYDDKTLFKNILKDRGRDFDDSVITDLITRKSNYFDTFICDNISTFPGVLDFIALTVDRYPLAIGSGALRDEIEFILKSVGVGGAFDVIVSADDVKKSKPDPETYVKALGEINRLYPKSPTIKPSECLVIEDSVSGIKAAKSASMNCLAVTNSYSSDKLSEADLVVESLDAIDLEVLEKMFK